MPDPGILKPGDKVRLLAVPDADLEQRRCETKKGLPDAGWTAKTIETILAQDPVVTIARIDDYGLPWFDYELRGPDGTEEHSLAISDDYSWDYL
jgi:hypothetical protein